MALSKDVVVSKIIIGYSKNKTQIRLIKSIKVDLVSFLLNKTKYFKILFCFISFQNFVNFDKISPILLNFENILKLIDCRRSFAHV